MDITEGAIEEIVYTLCAGDGKEIPKDHLVIVNLGLDTGVQIDGIDFLPEEEADEKYQLFKVPGREIIPKRKINSHGQCLDCAASISGRNRNELMRYFPFYVGNPNKPVISESMRKFLEQQRRSSYFGKEAKKEDMFDKKPSKRFGR